jgi:prophage maintenance system killer protein
LVRGYTLNESRLREEGLHEIEEAVALLGRTLRRNEFVSNEGVALLDIIERYTNTWRMLPAYDAGNLPHDPDQPKAPLSPLTVQEARHAIHELRCASASRGETIELFGREHGQQLAGILGAVEQTFSGVPLYASAQGRAAHLLYFVVKDHPFVDGNKRIGALLFLEYLRRNDLFLLEGGAPRLDANAIVALTLFIAESEPSQKNLMIRLILGMLNDEPLSVVARRRSDSVLAARVCTVPAGKVFTDVASTSES